MHRPLSAAVISFIIIIIIYQVSWELQETFISSSWDLDNAVMFHLIALEHHLKHYYIWKFPIKYILGFIFTFPL